MGSNQVKTAPAPLLPVVSRAVSCHDDQERRIRQDLPRRLGSMVLYNWIQMKRREQEIVQKAQQAVEEGRAPPEVLQQIEKYVNKESKKHHIKYHPRLLARKPKPSRQRLRAPKLTNTAARRIQESFHRREREQQEAAKAARRQTRSRVSVKSQVWTDSTPSDTSRGTQIKRGARKRATSLPPSSTLSLQSITTAESSGIGMSRTSSMTSVASSRHKTFYTRQRVRSLEKEEEGVRELPERRAGLRSATSVDTRHQGEASRQHKCQASQKTWQQEQQAAHHAKQQPRHKSRSPQVGQQVPAQQKVNKQQPPRERSQHRDKDQQKSQNQENEREESHLQPSRRQSPLQQQSKEQSPQLHLKEDQQSETQFTKEQPSRQQKHEQQPSQLQENKQQPLHQQVNEGEPSQQRQQLQPEKKEQGSQTRLSGPPRPRRLLLTHHLRGRGQQSPDRQQQLLQVQPRTQSSRTSRTQKRHPEKKSSEHQKDQPVMREKRPSETYQSEKQEERRPAATILTDTQEDQELKPTSSRDRKPRPQHPLQSPQQASEDKRQTPYIALDDLEEGRHLERVPQMGRRKPNQIQPLENCGEGSTHQETREIEIVQISRHQVQVHHSPFSDDLQLQEHSRQHQQEGRELQRSVQQRRLSVQEEGNPPHRQTPQQDQGEPPGSQVVLPTKDHQQPQVASQQEERQTQDQTMERKQEAARGQTRWRGLFKQLRESRFTADSKDQGKERPGKSLAHSTTVKSQTEGSSGIPMEQEHSGESQTGTRTGRSLTQVNTAESQGSRHLGGSLERSATVESQGGGRPGKLSQHGRTVQPQGSRRLRTSLDRWRAAAVLNRRHTRTSSERGLSETSVEGRHSKQTTDRSSTEREPQQQPVEQVTREPVIERAHYEPPMQRERLVPPVELVQREPSIERVEHLRHEHTTSRIHHDVPMDRFRHEPSLERLHESSIIRVRRAPLVEYSRRESSTDRLPSAITMERVRHEPLIEHGRPDSPIQQGRMVYMERGRSRLSPERGQMRAYQVRSLSTEPTERRYTAETLEPGYIRSYHERRYIGGPIEQTGTFSESINNTRPQDAGYTRTYSDNSYNGRAVEPEYNRAYSEHSYTERSVDNDYNRVYSERILSGNRWKDGEEWVGRERGRYRRAVAAPASASSPPLNHRAL